MKGNTAMPGEGILLIDDSEARLTLMSQLLRHEGFVPVVAENGLAALTLPENNKVSLVVINAELIQPDGVELANRLRRSYRAWYLPILLLIPEEKMKEGQSPVLNGADGYIRFPCTATALSETIDDLLKEKVAKDYAESQLREKAKEHINDAVDEVAEQQLSAKSAEVVSNLSEGIVELVEVDARKAVEKRIEELTTGTLDELIRTRVEEVARVVLAEESEEIITRMVGQVVDQQIGQILGKVETDELPLIAARAVDKVAEEAARTKVEELARETHQELVNRLVSQIQSSVESVARKVLPGLIQEMSDK